MNLVVSPSAEIALRTLGDEDRRKIFAWFGYLRNWENDPFVQSKSRKLDVAGEDVYLLKTSTDIRIFFTIRVDGIEVIDIARRDSLAAVGHTS
jgi:hypothetical protein